MKNKKTIFFVFDVILAIALLVIPSKAYAAVNLTKSDFDQDNPNTEKGISYDAEYKDFNLESGEYVLDEDIDLEDTSIFVGDGDFIIDLNGKTLKSSENEPTIGFMNGSLTIKGNGTIINDGGSNSVYLFEKTEGESSKITLENTTFEGEVELLSSDVTIDNSIFFNDLIIRDSDVTVKDGTFESIDVKASKVKMEDGTINDYTSITDSELTIKTAKFNNMLSITGGNSNVTINGGTYTNNSNAISISNGATLVINGGIFTSTKGNAINSLTVPLPDDYIVMGPNVKSIEINGGTFTGFYTGADFTSVDSVAISAGTFEATGEENRGAIRVMFDSDEDNEQKFNSFLAKDSSYSEELQITLYDNIAGRKLCGTQSKISVIKSKPSNTAIGLRKADFDPDNPNTEKGIIYDEEYKDFDLEPGEYILEEDIDLEDASIYISGGDYVLDLNEKTLTSGEDKDEATILFLNGCLTIKGNGTISNKLNAYSLYVYEKMEDTYSKLIIENGTFSTEVIAYDADVIIKNGTFNADLDLNDCNLVIETATVNGMLSVYGEEITATINDGTYTNDSNTFSISNGATVIINGGNFVSSKGSAINTVRLPFRGNIYSTGPNAKYIEINGGIFTGNDTAASFTNVDKVSISSGTFKWTGDRAGNIWIRGKENNENMEEDFNSLLAEGATWSEEPQLSVRLIFNTPYWYIAQSEISVVNKEDKEDKEELEILNGGDQTYEDGQDVVIRVSGDLDKFKELQMDGIKVNKECYTLTSGSTIVTLKSSYLSTLSKGIHTLKFIYEGESIETTLKIASVAIQDDDTNSNSEPETETNSDLIENNKSSDVKSNTNSNPKTGDNIIMWISLLLVSIVGIVGTKKLTKKREGK